MKNTIKKWMPLVVVILVFGLISLLYALGFRITYAPELENSWDAISAVASWAGVIVSIVAVAVSGVAIWFAIQVPKKIADRQDKIALFEKRYECFQFFEKCMILCTDAENDVTLDSLQRHCCMFVGEYKTDDLNLITVIPKIENFEYILHSMEFLFPGLEEESLNELYRALELFFVSVLYENKDLKKNRDSFIQIMKKFQKKYGKVIWRYLYIESTPQP